MVCPQPAGGVCVCVWGLFWAFPTRLLHHRQKSLAAGARADSFLISLLVDQTLPMFLSAKAFSPHLCPHRDHFEGTQEEGTLSPCVDFTISHHVSSLYNATATCSPCGTRSLERAWGRDLVFLDSCLAPLPFSCWACSVAVGLPCL